MYCTCLGCCGGGLLLQILSSRIRSIPLERRLLVDYIRFFFHALLSASPCRARVPRLRTENNETPPLRQIIIGRMTIIIEAHSYL